MKAKRRLTMSRVEVYDPDGLEVYRRCGGATVRRTLLVVRIGALLYLLHGCVDLLLRLLHRFLRFLDFLLPGRGSGGRAAGHVEAATRERYSSSKGEKCLHRNTIGPSGRLAMP